MDHGFFFSSGGPPTPLHFDPAAWHSLSDQSPASILNPNWETPADISLPLHLNSGLSPILPSPAASNSNAPGDSFVMRELIGKLGTVCNSGEILPTSGNAPCFTPPLNPGKSGPLISSQFPARLAPSGNRSFNGRPNQTQLGPNRSSEFDHRSAPLMENVKLQRISNSPPLNPQLGQNQNQNQNQNPPLMKLQDQTQLANSPEESTVSEQNPIGENQPNSRKRRSKVKDSAPTPSIKNVEPHEDSIPKKPKTSTEDETKKKLPEPPKDYIHVRARRGQATDSHSLAERVRREKISERMRLLQDLVPGCNKVTGKALMLDEIINYVQSLQRQVEFLSMKLASVNTIMDFNIGSSTTKDVFGSNDSSMLQPMALDSSVFLGQNQAVQGLLDGFGEVASQHLTFSGDDLQSFVQMGFGQNRTLMSPNVQGSNQGCSEMKIEI